MERHDAHDHPPADASATPDRDDLDLTTAFWGSIPDWSATASTSRRSGRRPIGGADGAPIDPTPIGERRPTTIATGVRDVIRGWWSTAFDAGARATREHRIPCDDAPPNEHRASVPAVDGPPGDADDVAIAATDIGVAFTPRDLTATDDPPIDGEAGPNRPPLDPLLVRLGSLAIVLTLLVPLFVNLRGGDGDTDVLAGATSTPPAAETPGEVADQSDATTTAADSAPPVLDPALLPPATPVDAGDTDAATTSPNSVAAEQPTQPTTSGCRRWMGSPS